MVFHILDLQLSNCRHWSYPCADRCGGSAPIRVGIASSLAELSFLLSTRLSELLPTSCAEALQPGFGSGHMPLEWRTRKAPPIGLRVQKLPYGHLHEHCGGNFNAEREKAETDIYGPPLSDSDEKSPSLPPSPKPKPEYPPPAKRRRLDTRSSQQSDPTSSPSVKKEQYPADISRTTFTPSTPSSCHHLGSTENKAPSSSLDSRTAIKDEAEDLFPEYTASQSKASKTYQRNFHKAASVRPEQKQRVAEQEKTESMVKCQPNGFKIPDTEALIALGMGSLCSHQWFTLMLRKFDPLKKGVRRPNSSNQLDHPQAQDRRGREDVQQTKNPTVQGQLVRNPLRGHHKHRALPSENLPHGHSSKCQKGCLLGQATRAQTDQTDHPTVHQCPMPLLCPGLRVCKALRTKLPIKPRSRWNFRHPSLRLLLHQDQHSTLILETATPLRP